MRIATWNMQGGNASTENKWNACVLPLLSQAKADAVCVQECGDRPPSADKIAHQFVVPNPANPGQQLIVNCYQWGSKRAARFVTFYRWDVNGNRCNLAIVSGQQPADVRLLMGVGGAQWRPVLGVELAGNWIFTIHAISPGGADAPGLVQAVASNVGGAFAVAGDFNSDPDVLGPRLPAGTTPFPPAANTYSTQKPTAKYDYLVAPSGTKVSGGNVVTQLVFSDHFPVLFGL